LLLTMRAVALRLRRMEWTRRRIGYSPPGRGLEASALSAQCGCWCSAARRGVDGLFAVQGDAGESRIDRRQSTRQILYDEFWLLPGTTVGVFLLGPWC
jgi:hypothetical protein